MRKFCPKCGKDTDKLIDSLCYECYNEHKKLFVVNEPLRLEICNCGKLFEKNRWVIKDSLKKAIDKYLNDNIKAEKDTKINMDYDLSQMQYVTGKVKIYITITGEKSGFFDEKKKILTIITTFCPECTRLKSGYFEATIQLRGKINKNKEIKEYIEQRTLEYSKKIRNSFILSCEKIPNGYDFKMGSKKVTNKIARELHEKYDMVLKDSYKIYGQIDGKEVHRTTIAITDKKK
ncbi:MAG: 60S ribosomal export protein NMD3 [DPANN group archaeon]|nr:60S ribosomal export protein NMD3 [DPANN group archaeon]